MERDVSSASVAFADEGDAGYDPFADFEIDDEEYDESGGQQGPCAAAGAPAVLAPKPDGRSVPQRIEDLFEAWASRRRVLLGILEFADRPQRSDEVRRKVDELQECDTSVYSGCDYALLLEEAGALRKANADGSVFDDRAERVPDIVEIDGVRFYRPVDGSEVYWVATDEGRAYRDADDPFGRLSALLADEVVYAPVYRRLLERCSEEGGCAVGELERLVNDDPLVQKPRRYCSYFLKKLEDCDALAWSRSWRTTEVGARGLDLLRFRDAEDAFASKKGE